MSEDKAPSLLRLVTRTPIVTRVIMSQFASDGGLRPVKLPESLRARLNKDSSALDKAKSPEEEEKIVAALDRFIMDFPEAYDRLEFHNHRLAEMASQNVVAFAKVALDAAKMIMVPMPRTIRAQIAANASALLKDWTSSPPLEPRESSISFMREWGSYTMQMVTEQGAEKGTALATEMLDKKLSKWSLAKEPAAVQAFHDTLMLAALWANSGFPCIVPSEKLAASLMATHPPKYEELNHVVVPWKTLIVEVPQGLRMEPFSDIEFIGLSVEMNKFTFFIGRTNRSAATGTTHESLSEVAGMCLSGPPSMRLYYRLLIGAILEIGEHRPSLARGRTKVVKDGTFRRNEVPKTWIIRLTRDVRVDARKWVQLYFSSGGKAPDLRLMVRGHWKDQHYGPASSLIKHIHIEPYWRGDSDAPIAVRRHISKKAAP